MKKIIFSEQEKQNIKKAVSKVEKTTSGEIVTFFANKSNNYIHTAVFSSLITGLFFLLLINILSFFWLLPFKFNITVYSLYQVLFMGIAFILIYFIPILKRPLIRKAKLSKEVHNKAIRVFVSEEVFNTKERTGILIFISEFEHMVEIIADSGINQKIKDDQLTEIVQTIISGIKNKRTAEGIVTAIHLYGNLLFEHGYAIKQDDINELKNDLRTDK